MLSSHLRRSGYSLIAEASTNREIGERIKLYKNVKNFSEVASYVARARPEETKRKNGEES